MGMAAPARELANLLADTPTRRADIQGMVKASEQFTKAMEHKGISQATLMVHAAS